MGVARGEPGAGARPSCATRKRNLTRSRELAAKNFISGATLDSAVARSDKARAAVRGAGGVGRGAGELRPPRSRSTRP